MVSGLVQYNTARGKDIRKELARQASPQVTKKSENAAVGSIWCSRDGINIDYRIKIISIVMLATITDIISLLQCCLYKYMCH